MTDPSDWIHDGEVTTTWPDGHTTTEPLNYQGLATDETADKLLDWLDTNIPEGAEWTKKNINISQGQVSYNCPSWQAVAKNGFIVSCGHTWYNLFFYPNPTQATLDELHKGASAPVE